MEHEWYDLRDAYPPQIKRRLARMAALLEVAESEFLAMRKEKSDHQKSISIAVAAKVEEVRLDSSSLVSFIEGNKTVARIDQRIADLTGKSLSETSDSSAIAAEAAACLAANINTIEQLRTLLTNHGDAIVEYIESLESRPRSSAKRNPYIAIGACLFHLAIIMISGDTDRERVVQTIKKHYNTGVDVELIAEVAGAIAQKYSLTPSSRLATERSLEE
jgi:GTP pyrophosphokinase